MLAPAVNPAAGERAADLGVDLATEVPAVAEWVAALPGSLVLGNYVYADGHAKYEAHVQKADGSQATVYVNDNFEVVSVESR